MNYIAPLQGHTDAPWRTWHHREYGGDLRYFTPFIRVEKGRARPHDLRDFTSALNEGVNLTPQVIFSNADELRLLLRELVACGASSVNLNMGCPFPLQTSRGRGAGLLEHPERLEALPDIAAEFAPLTFSVKMRVGCDDPSSWRRVIPILNRLPLEFVSVHPRTARQQYAGALHLDEFQGIADASAAPVLFNGDLRTPADIADIFGRFPGIGGVMAGRGILGRPSLYAEYDAGREWPLSERIERMLRLHDRILEYYSATLCGDSQILSKIRPFWEYAEAEIGHKALKAIRKAGTMPKYRAALALL